MNALYVFYDEACGFCCRCAEWLRGQPSFLPLAVLPSSQLPVEKSAKKSELVVIDDAGGVYRDTDAWLMTLWALREWREWAVRLSKGNRELARKVVDLAGTWRYGLSQLFKLTSDVELRRGLERVPSTPGCDDEQCALPACRSCGASTRPGHSFCAKCLADALRS